MSENIEQQSVCAHCGSSVMQHEIFMVGKSMCIRGDNMYIKLAHTVCSACIIRAIRGRKTRSVNGVIKIALCKIILRLTPQRLFWIIMGFMSAIVIMSILNLRGIL